LLPFASDLDEKHFSTKLRPRVARGDMIAFVGAGLSARAGFADWRGLLAKLEEAVGSQQLGAPITRTKNADLADLSWQAEVLRDAVEKAKGDYFGILASHFRGPGTRDAGIRTFAGLPFSHFITTNYDVSLERALVEAKKRPVVVNWRAAGEHARVMKGFRSARSRRPYLIYLHGRFDAPASIVLSERDYRAQYVRSDETVKKLFAVFSMRSALFVGFSLRDLDVLSVFRQVRAADEDAEHFAILPNLDAKNRRIPERDLQQLRLRYANKFGINAVFYEPGGERHPRLVNVLRLAAGGSPARRRRPRRRAAASAIYRGPRWTATATFRNARGKADPDDPQKGRFRGSAVCNGRKLSARISRSDSRDWYELELIVRATNGRPLTGKVDLWVHDSFPQEHYFTFARNGVAKFTFSVFGSFTVGATCDAGNTPLELDLARVKGPPGWPPD
jgi:hypothetical protein